MKTLIVDDDRMVSRFVAKLADRLDFDVDVREDGLSALAQVREQFYPLIVTDIYMPGMTGLEFCRRLRALPGGRFAVVLVMTAYDHKESLKAVLDAGADDYMVKPIQLEHLKARLTIARRLAMAREYQRQVEEELQGAKERAEAASRAKTEFLANMSHDLRTPLNGILGFAQILLQSNGLTDRQRESIGIIQHSGEHLLTMINDVLDLSKIEARKMELDQEVFFLPEFLERIADMSRGQIRARGKLIGFCMEFSDALPDAVWGDEIRLRQVLLNLLSNAIKYTDAGEIRFQVGLAVPPDVASETVSLRFAVADTGIGIPREQREAIFHPFHQSGDAALRSEGTGLGLAICRRLVDMMNGTLHLESQPGAGSRFWFDLNLPVAPAAAAAPGSPDGMRLQGAGRRILVADNQPRNRQVLREMLAASDFDVIEAQNGRDLIRLALARPPHLILMDMALPDITGLDAARILRRMPVVRDIPLIIVSANVFEAARRASLAIGCDGFLAKPIRIAELLGLLQRLMGLDAVRSVATTPPRCSPHSRRNMKIPDPDRLHALLDPLLIGDISGFRELLAALDLFPEFRDYLAELADGFRLDALQEELERRLTEAVESPSASKEGP
jgi:signal transduction histidine kinase